MDIKKQCWNYIMQSMILVLVVLNVLGHLVMRIWGLDIKSEMAASMVFVLVVEVTSALVWRWVALKHKEMLPSFFTGVSGFRFLGALVMLLIWYLAVGSEGMLTFIPVFFAYYIVSLMHHSIFFSIVSKRI